MQPRENPRADSLPTSRPSSGHRARTKPIYQGPRPVPPARENICSKPTPPFFILGAMIAFSSLCQGPVYRIVKCCSGSLAKDSKEHSISNILKKRHTGKAKAPASGGLPLSESLGWRAHTEGYTSNSRQFFIRVQHSHEKTPRRT